MRRLGGFDRLEHCVRRLNAIEPLSTAARTAIFNLSEAPRKYGAGRDLYAPDGPRESQILLAGWACRHQYFAGGRRHVFDVLIPGDFIAPRPPGWDAHCIVSSLTDCVTMPASDLSALPDLQRVLAKGRIEEDRRMLANAARLGRTTAPERIADFFCKLYDRLDVVGLAFKNKISAPLTQEILAEILALSPVHLNRTLRELRYTQVMDLHRGWATILDRPMLERLATGETSLSSPPRRETRSALDHRESSNESEGPSAR